jgi:para-aminobenzoate synthetase / 4-amino-4-deoxychorismate lyase
MPRALLHDPWRGRWLAFDAPRAEHRVTDLASLPNILRVVCDAAATHESWAVCMLSYESAPAFDPSCSARASDEFPLAWFALFDPPNILTSLPPADLEPPPAGGALPTGAAARRAVSDLQPDAPWRPSIDIESYTRAIHRIRNRIAHGDTYQVNFTFRLRKEFPHDPYSLFHALASRETPPFAAYLDLGSHAICSFSPELFFRLDGDLLVSRPMKGTSPRGLSSGDDLLTADRLRRSPKNRAENTMIVDMVRNDLGRVARVGSVAVSSMYDIEQYPTVWQMTSTVEAYTDAPVPEIIAALFPPASITGAPKIRTMELIRELEDSLRHVYTGAIGWVAPGRTAQFSVAIRTLVADRKTNEAEYGVGGGIVWDSDPREEYQECITKAAVLGRRHVEFSLLETMLWTPAKGIGLLKDHLARLGSSARYFGMPFDETLIRQQIAKAVGSREETVAAGRRVRLLLARNGAVTIESAPIQPLCADGPSRVKLAADPIDPRDPFLYHKTTHRAIYDRARGTAGECDDAILWNTRNEVTESCIATVVVDIGGSLFTPPVACGLLPGVSRARLLRTGTVRERIITVDDLRQADRLYLSNAVRGMFEARLQR